MWECLSRFYTTEKKVIEHSYLTNIEKQYISRQLGFVHKWLRQQTVVVVGGGEG